MRAHAQARYSARFRADYGYQHSFAGPPCLYVQQDATATIGCLSRIQGHELTFTRTSTKRTIYRDTPDSLPVRIHTLPREDTTSLRHRYSTLRVRRTFWHHVPAGTCACPIPCPPFIPMQFPSFFQQLLDRQMPGHVLPTNNVQGIAGRPKPPRKYGQSLRKTNVDTPAFDTIDSRSPFTTQNIALTTVLGRSLAPILAGSHLSSKKFTCCPMPRPNPKEPYPVPARLAALNRWRA